MKFLKTALVVSFGVLLTLVGNAQVAHGVRAGSAMHSGTLDSAETKLSSQVAAKLVQVDADRRRKRKHKVHSLVGEHVSTVTDDAPTNETEPSQIGVDPPRPATIVPNSDREIKLPDGDTAKAFIAKFTLDVSLYDGQNMYTDIWRTRMRTLPQDFFILEQTAMRQYNRDTGEEVSLDELYNHHIVISPMAMAGAEVLGRDRSNPFLSFPPGYGFFCNVTEHWDGFWANAHFLSSKNVKPINGSIPLARKHCAECKYSPTKGADCTPELDGTFNCCGDSDTCRKGANCYCDTMDGLDTTRITRYTIELEMVVTYEVEKITNLYSLGFAAPLCTKNRKVIGEPYPANNYCSSVGQDSAVKTGSLFHHVLENATHPMQKTVGRYIIENEGKFRWAQPHLHTGGVNATFKLNGKVICSSQAIYGKDDNIATNARNEFGHLVDISVCMNEKTHPDGIAIKPLDVLELETFYNVDPNDPNMPKGNGGSHTNVMSMLFTAFELPPENAQRLVENIGSASSQAFWNDWLAGDDFFDRAPFLVGHTKENLKKKKKKKKN